MTVVELFRQHRQYEKMTILDEVNHIMLPIQYGRLVYYKGVNGHVAFTWTRPTNGYSVGKLASGKADPWLWQDHTEDMSFTPWIVDVAGDKRVTGREIGTFLRKVSVIEGIAKEGQKVLFHRSGGIRTGRIGFFTARGTD